MHCRQKMQNWQQLNIMSDFRFDAETFSTLSPALFRSVTLTAAGCDRGKSSVM